jgi:hypothetical protein
VTCGLNPHLHTVFLDGTHHQDGGALAWSELGHLRTREVGEVLEQAVRRMARYLERHLLLTLHDRLAFESRDDPAEIAGIEIERVRELGRRPPVVSSERSPTRPLSVLLIRC